MVLPLLPTTIMLAERCCWLNTGESKAGKMRGLGPGGESGELLLRPAVGNVRPGARRGELRREFTALLEAELGPEFGAVVAALQWPEPGRMLQLPDRVSPSSDAALLDMVGR